jgi:hypothetical protein
MGYFNLPEMYVNEMSFEKSAEIIKHYGYGDLLKGMELMQKLWVDYCTTDMSDDYYDDDEFYENYEYQMNAYNVVHENMSKLFA